MAGNPAKLLPGVGHGAAGSPLRRVNIASGPLMAAFALVAIVCEAVGRRASTNERQAAPMGPPAVGSARGSEVDYGPMVTPDADPPLSVK